MSDNIPIFSTLYKKNKTNKISEWSIKIIKLENETFKILTTHGELEGKKINHEKIIEKGKGKKTILEQAIQDASKKWNDKKDKELYIQNLDEINDQTDTNIIVRPMLANKFSFDVYEKKKKSFKIEFPLAIQRKYDGIRCIAYLKNNEIIIESRKGIPFQNFNNLKNELKNILKELPEGFYFDGELFTDKLDFETISGLIRLHEKSIKEKDLVEIDKIDYYIYDFIDTNNLNRNYGDRNDFLKGLFKKNNYVKCFNVETIIINKLNEVKEYHDNFVKNGFEGIMIRDLNGIYEINKRSKYLQKFKEFFEEEFTIIGFHEGDGDEKGAIIWECEINSNKFSVRPKGTFERRKELFLDGDKYIGKKLTVIFQEYTNDGIPRFPVGKSIRDIY